MLDSEVWCRRVFAGGWREGAGGDVAVVEPATGAELGRVGMAGVEDLAASAAQAVAAQLDWAQVSFQERAAILRRAGDVLQRNTDELRDWLVRETGGIPGKAYFELQMAAEECYEAAALPSRAQGELLPSWPPRLSMARRVPVGVVGVIAPFTSG